MVRIYGFFFLGSLLVLLPTALTQGSQEIPDPDIRYEYDICGGTYAWACEEAKTLENCIVKFVTMATPKGSEVRAIWDCDGYAAFLADHIRKTPPTEGLGPIVRLDSPTEGATLEGFVTVSGWAVDEGFVESVEFLVDGQPVALEGFSQDRHSPEGCQAVMLIGKDRCRPDVGFRGSLDTRGFIRGWHQLQMKATDGIGWQTYHHHDVYMEGCERVPPTISLKAPAPGATLAGTIQLEPEVEDNDRVTRVELLVDGATITSRTEPPYTLTWNTTTVDDGNHTLEVRAWDACKNSQRSPSRMVAVNNALEGAPPYEAGGEPMPQVLYSSNFSHGYATWVAASAAMGPSGKFDERLFHPP